MTTIIDRERWGNARHHSHRARYAANRELAVQHDRTVAQGAPELLPHMDKWLAYKQGGLTTAVRIKDCVRDIKGVAHVMIEREFPYTGGVVPVDSLLAQLPKPSALGFPVCTAIVVWRESKTPVWGF